MWKVTCGCVSLETPFQKVDHNENEKQICNLEKPLGTNAYDLTDFDREERLLLLYGSGHVWQLRQFFMDSPDFEYVEPNKYLTK